MEGYASNCLHFLKALTQAASSFHFFRCDEFVFMIYFLLFIAMRSGYKTCAFLFADVDNSEIVGY